LCDAFQVPKPLSPQLQPFGKSDDDLGGLTFEVGLFFCSVRASRTVRGVQADGPRRTCSSGVLRVLSHLSLRFVVILSFGWTKFRTVRNSGRTVRGCLADSPPHLAGRTVRSRAGRSAAGPDGPRCVCADSPRQQAGRSAWPVWTVRPTWQDSPPEPECFVPWFDSSLPSFVLPRVLQGIVPMTRG
jgi:hypothetical protein